MSTFEEIKKKWTESEGTEPSTYTQASLHKIIRSRVRMHTKESFKYFWASFTLQMIIYALLSHVVIKYWHNSTVLYFAIAGILLYIPFTILLMRKFKNLATGKPLLQEDIGNSLYDHVLSQQVLLRSFYKFKRWYEMLLMPISCAIGVLIVFELYVPGGVQEHWRGAMITFLLSLISCIAAIYAENKKSFILPIQQLQHILDEFDRKD